MALLSIDLGLKTGFAVYAATGELVEYRSTRFPSSAAMKRAAWGVLRDVEDLTHVVVEGDKYYAGIWRKVAEKQDLEFQSVTPETWRETMLLPRERRDSASAKKAAFELAEAIVRDSDVPNPTSMTSDVAEAILIGRWAVQVLGWGE